MKTIFDALTDNAGQGRGGGCAAVIQSTLRHSGTQKRVARDVPCERGVISLLRGRDEYIDLRVALTELSAFFGFVTPWTAMQAYARGRI